MRSLLVLVLGLFSLSATAALPVHSAIDVPQKYGAVHNNSDEYLYMDITPRLSSSSASPGIYRWDDVMAGNYTPVVSLSYFSAAGGSDYGVIELADGSKILPIEVVGDTVYGNRITSSSLIDAFYKCPVADLIADQSTGCSVVSENQYMAISGEFASGSGWRMTRVKGTNPVQLVVYPPDSSGLSEQTIELGAADAVTDFRVGPSGDTAYILLGDRIESVTPEVLVADASGSSLQLERVDIQTDTAPTVTSGNVLLPIAITQPQATYPGTDQFRVVFADYNGSGAQAAALWTADYNYDGTSNLASLAGTSQDENQDGYFKLTGDSDPFMAIINGAIGASRSRITNDGALITVIGDEDGSLADLGYIDLATDAVGLGGIENGTGIERSTEEIMAGPVTDIPLVALSVSECGNVSVTTAQDNDDPATYETKLFVNEGCSSSSDTISLEPSQTNVDPGEKGQISVDVRLDSQSIHGIDMTCTADDEVLQLVEGNLGTLFGSDALVVGPTVSGNEWQVAVSRSGTDEPLEASGVFATLTYNVLFTTADTQINCSAEASNGDGKSVPVDVQPGTVSVDDGIHGGTGTVSGQVQLPVGADHSGITVSIHRDGNQFSTTTDANGSFSFANLRDGAFSITYQADQYVADCDTARVVSGGTVNLGSTTMMAGDINADGIIDIGDFTLMASSYGLSDGDADFDARADLNADGEVSIRDLSILGSHFGLNVCDPANKTIGCGFDSLEGGKILPGSFVDPKVNGMGLSVESAADESGNFGTPSLTGVMREDVPSLTESQTYIESTYDGASSLDGNVAMVAGALRPDGGSGAAVRVLPQSGNVERRVATGWETVFSGVSISAGYTVGLAVNHDTGSLVIQDSQGNSTTVPEGAASVDSSLYATLGGQPGLQEGDTVSATLRVSPDDYILTPPAESQDWCGTAL